MMGRGELRNDGRSETLQATLAADDVTGWSCARRRLHG